ncbi:MAG: cytochrome c, partial [Gemmatimonadetes bacterium]|nr:cytochrome c [Gemmatimonadota bacterium]
MLNPSSKKRLLAVLVLCFLAQSIFVYRDDVDLELSMEAIEGRQIYHESACQVCHQLWGQGGFLGPDLTNAASRVDEARLVSLLTVWSGQMPAFNFNSRQIDQMKTFMNEIDR